MLITDRQVDTKVVPSVRVSVAEVVFQPSAKINRQAHVIEFRAFVECVDSISSLDVGPYNVREVFEQSTRDMLEMLTYQLGSTPAQ